MNGVKLNRSKSYYSKPHGNNFCEICGKSINKSSGRYAIIHMNNADEVVPMDAELDPSEDMGLFIIGLDCLRSHPELKSLAEEE